MSDEKDYYQIVGVDPKATSDEIRRAYYAKAMDYHPDRLHRVSDGVRHLAEDKLKEINAAYGVLRDPQKRQQYDADRLRRNSPPKPEVTPSYISFNDVEPGHKQSGSFVIGNAGGPYSNIRVSDPDSWVTLTDYESLTEADELPLRVEIEAQGVEWGERYEENISVSLDEAETTVRVELRTKSAPKTSGVTATPRPSRVSTGAPSTPSSKPGATTVLCPRCGNQNARFASYCDKCSIQLSHSASAGNWGRGVSTSTVSSPSGDTRYPVYGQNNPGAILKKIGLGVLGAIVGFFGSLFIMLIFYEIIKAITQFDIEEASMALQVVSAVLGWSIMISAAVFLAIVFARKA